jgi:poly(A) polymerase
MTRLQAHFLDDPAAGAVMSMLTSAGYQAWFVGGCVRNALMNRPVTDLDVTTDARPERVMELAEEAGLRAVPTGIDHGTITVVSGGAPFEITTFRRDVATDGRRATVAFSDTIEEDAARRDFTMNAIYAAPDGTLADPVGGLPDLQARKVRFIGDPALRIEEDYLRILRFFRFHAIYGDPSGGIDADGLAACTTHLDGIPRLSRERVGAEMMKLLGAPDPAPSLGSMQASHVLTAVLPGASAEAVTILVHLEDGREPDAVRRLAALGGEDVAERLRLSKANARRLETLRSAALGDWGMAEMGYRLGATDAEDAALVRAALMQQPVGPEEIASLRDGARQTFPVKAADLMPAYSGPALGERLRTLESRWIASGFTLSKEALLRPDPD